MPGTTTSDVEVTNISQHGLWMLIDEREHFLAFDHFPWFRSASVGSIHNVERLRGSHFHWPDLDVDLSLASIEDPGRYPLVAR